MSQEELLVARAQRVVEQVIAEGAIDPHELEARLLAVDPSLDGSVVGIAVLRLLRNGRIALSDEFDFVPATRGLVVTA